MLFPFKIAPFLWEIALFYTNFDYKFSNLWRKVDGHKVWELLSHCTVHVLSYLSSNFRKCKQPFPDGNFFEQDGFPYCEYCYHEMRGAPCAGCGKPISGRCITAMFRKFHPEHFVCSFCLKQLNKGTFKEQDDKPYCHGCFDRLFGWNARSTSPLLCTSKFLSVRGMISFSPFQSEYEKQMILNLPLSFNE